jgi:hypothetical protein
MHRREEFASLTEHRSSNAAMRDVPMELLREEFVSRTAQRKSDANSRDVPSNS